MLSRVGELPQLELEEGSFDPALFSHFLFLYSDPYSYGRHRVSVYGMSQIPREA